MQCLGVLVAQKEHSAALACVLSHTRSAPAPTAVDKKGHERTPGQLQHRIVSAIASPVNRRFSRLSSIVV